jgi:hypothetical protein
MRIALALLFAGLLTMDASAQFTKGNLVVVQMGDGSAALSSASTPVFLSEYTTEGSLVQKITIPSTGSSPRLTVTGNSGSEGHLIQSTDGHYLTIAGYDTVSGAASFALAATKRAIARIDASGNVDLTTELTDGSTAAVRAAVMDNNSNTWMATSSVGIRYKQFGSVGTSTQLSSASPTNTRVVKIFNGQLYITSASGTFLGVSSIGSGTPTTSGQTTTALSGMPTTGTHSPYSFSISPDGNTLYIADDGSAANGGGIQKWTQSSGTWSKAYTLLNNGTTNTPARGLTADWSGTNPVIYATTGTSSPNALIEVTDTGSGSTADTLAISPTNTVFRGVDFAPTNGSAFIAVTGGPLSFGNTAVATASAAQTVTVRGGNLTNNITVTAPAQFEVSTTSGSGFSTSVTLTQTNGAVNTTTIYVQYNPTTLGAASGNITIASTGATSQSIAVSGNGIQAGFQVSPSSISFGNVILTENKEDSLYVKNTGTNSLNITSVISDNALFTVTPSAAALSSGDSGWFYIKFAPTSTGAKSGNIVFTNNAPSSPDTVKVTGTGINAPPPSIGTITRSTRVPNSGDSVVVSAKITDQFGLTAVRLIYYVNGVADSLAMTSPDSVYTGKIPGSVNQNGTRIEYRIHAISNSGQDTLTAKAAANAYFAGISPISLSGLKAEDANLANLYVGYYVRVTGVINGPNYQTSNLSQYIQDASGGLNLYEYGAVANAFNLGDSLVVLGKLDQYRGTTELTPDTVAKDIQLVGTGKTVTPIDLTVAQFNANPESYESRLVRLSGLYKKYATTTWANSASITLYGGSQTDTVIMYINAGVDAANAPEPTYPVRMTAIAVQFAASASATTGPYEIQPRYKTDFETTPAAPTLVSLNGAAYQRADTLVLKWHPSATANKYLFQLFQTSVVSSKFITTYVVSDSNVTDTTRKVIGLLNATKYYWQVSGINDVGFGPFSKLDSFTTIVSVPAKPKLVSPVGGKTGVARIATFVWDSTALATKYELQVASDKAFSKIVKDITVKDTTVQISDTLLASTTYYWRVSAIDTAGATVSDTESFTTGTAVGIRELTGIPKEFALFQNYPNPFNPSTTIRYDLPKNAYVKVTIYDILGRVVANLVDESETANEYSVEWDPYGLSSGVYFCRIQAESLDGSGKFMSVKKLVYMK